MTSTPACAKAAHAGDPGACGSKELILLPFYPALTPSARKRALGPCWANLATRLTALSVGAMGCNARAEVIELSRMVRGCKWFEWREVEAALRDGPAAARNYSFALLPSTYPFSAQARPRAVLG